MRAELIYNAKAGPIAVRHEMGDVRDFLEHRGWNTTIQETRAPLEATRLAREAAERGIDVVVAVGGDGTVNEVAAGLIETDTALGVLPVGTTNVWALQMHIPALNPVGVDSQFARLTSDLEQRIDHKVPLSHYRTVLLNAAHVLLHGDVVSVDVGVANDRHFLLWCGVGLDAAVTESVPAEQKKSLGPLAFVGTTLNKLRDYKNASVTLTLDGTVRRVATSLIVASNIQLYGGILPLGARAYVNDGKLDVCVFHGEGILRYLQHVFKVAARTHVEDTEIDYYQAREVNVESSTPLPVHVDDEPFSETPVTIGVRPRALRAIVPQNVPRDLFV
jgi:diacylglycerol kinase (ATP)